MRVKDIMTTDVACCNPGTNLAAAAEMFWIHDCGALPVLDDRGHVIGIVTDRDLCIALGTRDRKASELCVGDVMQPRLITCDPEVDLQTALRIMAAEQVRRLLVVDATECLQGILCINDIVLHAYRSGDGIRYEDTFETLIAICSRPGSAPMPEKSLLIPEKQRAVVVAA
jgi:CBS domain-containing protein